MSSRPPSTTELEPVRLVRAAPWLHDQHLREVMDALGAGRALMVGGCVREALLPDGHVADIDIATPLKPKAVITLLEKAGLKAVPTGLDHGTVTAVNDGRHFEITTLRRDIETDGRHASVAFTGNWAEDARRRDFTVNTLLMDIEGRVFDPLEAGLLDLDARRVRFVGDPDTRIGEDYLRILRYFRFYARFGGKPDMDAIEACAAAAVRLDEISRERVTTEMAKLVLQPHAADALVLMRDNRILPKLVSYRFSREEFTVLEAVERATHLPNSDTRLYLVAGDIAVLEQKLVLSRKQQRFFKDLDQFMKLAEPPSLRAGLYRHGRAVMVAGLGVMAAKGYLPQEQAIDAINAAAHIELPTLPFNAGDVMEAAGLGQGPELGALHKALEEWWLENDCAPTTAQCLAEIGRLRRL